jgi:hypothetical protein
VKRASQISALVVLILAVYIMVVGLTLGYTDKKVPAAGFTPFWIGVILAILSVGVFWESNNLTDEQFITRKALRIMTLLTISGVATIVLSRFFGLLISLALLAGAIMYFLGARPKQTVLTMFAVGVSFYLLFIRFLTMSFPRGFFNLRGY